MDTKEHLLTCIIEECLEIQKAATKALRFGLDDGYPGGSTTNSQDISIEFVDLLVVVDMCREHGIAVQRSDSAELYKSKRKKVERFMKYARKTGALS